MVTAYMSVSFLKAMLHVLNMHIFQKGDDTFARLFQNLRLRYHMFARIFQ